MPYIGPNKIENTAGADILSIEYTDGTKEIYSKLMYDKVVSEEPCDLTTLRERRIVPVVKEVLTVLRNWGIKLNELPYMSAVLNESLKTNENEALKELWKTHIPNLNTLDDIDLINIDLILRAKKPDEPKQ